MTVIIVSHSMEDIAKYTNRILIMNHGRVAYEGKPSDIFQHRCEIEKMGLAIPQASYVVQELARRGYPVDRYACTVQAAADSLAKLLSGGGAHA